MMFVDQKAQEVSLALIKVSVYARRPEFRHKLERLALELVELVSARDFSALMRNTAAIEGLVNFGRTIYEIEPVNADILLHELSNLRNGMSQVAELALPDLEKTPNIETVFSRPATLFETIRTEKSHNKERKRERKNTASQEIILQSKDKNPAIIGNPANQQNPASPREVSRSETIAGLEVKNPATVRHGSPQDNPAIDDNPAKRETAIVEKIRQAGDKPVQFKDIIAALPDFSERTLRYDLQRLSNRGVLERLGPGGPATYYKIRVI